VVVFVSELLFEVALEPSGEVGEGGDWQLARDRWTRPTTAT